MNWSRLETEVPTLSSYVATKKRLCKGIRRMSGLSVPGDSPMNQISAPPRKGFSSLLGS